MRYSYVNLLGARQGNEDLDAFAKEFFAAICVTEFEERESCNYIGGHYFIGTRGEMTFTVMLQDEEGHEDLPYWVQVMSDSIDEDALVSDVDSMVRTKALPRGFRFARVINFGKRYERQIDY
jgi:hypothetical protein